jgi:hypothetical protein
VLIIGAAGAALTAKQISHSLDALAFPSNTLRSVKNASIEGMQIFIRAHISGRIIGVCVRFFWWISPV